MHFRFPVFPKVTVDTEVVILQKGLPNRWRTSVTVAHSLENFLGLDGSDRSFWHDQQKWRALDGAAINIFMSPAEGQLAEKCLAAGTPLRSIFDVNVGIKPYQAGKGKPPQTKEIVRTRPYDSERFLDHSFRPYLRGGDIGRYKLTPLETRFIKYGP